MFLPGLAAPAPEVLAALMEGSLPTPFEALADGVDVWERRFGLFPEVGAYVGEECLPRPMVETRAMPGGTLAGGPDELELLPQWQRVVSAGETLPDAWTRMRRDLLRQQEAAEKKRGKKAQEDAKGALFNVAVTYSGQMAEQIRHSFGLIGRSDMDVLRRKLAFLEQGICRWAWVVGLFAWKDRPLIPSLVLQAMTEDTADDPLEVLEALTVVRVLQGRRSMAGYVLSRWLVELVWGGFGLSAQMPHLGSPLTQELPWAWQRWERMVEGAPYLSKAQQEELEALRWDSARPNGIAWGMRLLWERVFGFAGCGERGTEFKDLLEKPWTEDSDPYGEAKAGEAITESWAKHCWLSAQYEMRDRDSREARVLLPVITPELTTSAALLVLRWRYLFASTRVWKEPASFVLEMESWIAHALVRWDGGCVEERLMSPDMVENHMLRPSYGLWSRVRLAVLPDEKREDWRVVEMLRPLLFSALSSMAIGLKAGHGAALQELDWVREKVWDPLGPVLRVDQVFAQLLMLCSHEKCTVPRLRALDQRLARQLGVQPVTVEAWLAAQPFDLNDLEAFRQRVQRKEVEAGMLGGLVETLNARAHFKPTWVTGPLTGLATPRPHGSF